MFLYAVVFSVERRRSLRHEETDNRRQLMSEKYTRQRGSRRGDAAVDFLGVYEVLCSSVVSWSFLLLCDQA